MPFALFSISTLRSVYQFTSFQFVCPQFTSILIINWNTRKSGRLYIRIEEPTGLAPFTWSSRKWWTRNGMEMVNWLVDVRMSKDNLVSNILRRSSLKQIGYNGLKWEMGNLANIVTASDFIKQGKLNICMDFDWLMAMTLLVIYQKKKTVTVYYIIRNEIISLIENSI